jgi:ERCC4-type nuclease
MFVSGAEHDRTFHDMGVVSNLPEEYGADFFWESPMGKVGVQRKAFPGDWRASMADGRLNRELLQMQALDVRVLVIEGEQRAKWSLGGNLMEQFTAQRYTKEQHRNLQASIGIHRGVVIEHTNDTRDTRTFIEDFKAWTMKDEHHALDMRPAAKPKDSTGAGFWDVVGNRDFQRYFLMSFYFIGPKRADAILDHFHGLPFQLTCSFEELCEIPGFGPVLAKRFMDVFNHYEPEAE